MKIIYTYYCGVHAFGMVFHAFEKGFRILESGVHFMTIILSSCYWRVDGFEKGVNFFGKGVHVYEKRFEKRFHIKKNYLQIIGLHTCQRAVQN